MVAESPELWRYVSDFLLLLTVPSAIVFAEQPGKWRAAIRRMSEFWHPSHFLLLRFNVHDALNKLFAKPGEGTG